MEIPAFYFDEANTDDEYAFVDVFGGVTVMIHRNKDGVDVEIYGPDPYGGCLAECSVPWRKIVKENGHSET